MRKIQLFGLLAFGLALASCSPSYAGEFERKHPRREQVLDRNQRTNQRLNAKEGSLGGHYQQLKAENRSIHQQQRSEVRANGGHITKAEQRQLNKDHNQLNKQIRQDHR